LNLIKFLFKKKSEKWLPYKEIKRPIIVQKLKPEPPKPAQKNIIIEYEKAKAVAVRQIIEEGIFRVDPKVYQSTQSNGEVKYVDRITDLPIENSKILQQLNIDIHNRNNTSNSSSSRALTSTSRRGSNINCDSLDALITCNQINGKQKRRSSTINNNNLQRSGSDQFDLSFFDSYNMNYELLDCGSSSTANGNGDSKGAQYETIKTCVPEHLAIKIIEEARAAGAIRKLNYDDC
jgi:hypothetical protein